MPHPSPPALLARIAGAVPRWALGTVVAGVVSAGAAGLFAAPASAQALVVVALQGEDAAVVHDAATGAVRARLPMATTPHEATVSTDGRRALVTEYGDAQTVGHRVHVVDLAAGTVVQTLDLAPHTRPHGIAFLPGDTAFVVTSETSRAVLRVGLATGRMDVYPTTRRGSHLLALPADARRVYTANIPNGDATEIDLSTRATRTLPLLPASEGVAVTPDGRWLWGASRSQHRLVVVDLTAGVPVDTLDAPGLPYRIATTPDGARVLVATPAADAVRVYDAATRALLGVIAVPGGPAGLAIAPDSRTAYAALLDAGEVAVIDLTTLGVVRRFAVGTRPDGIAVTASR